MEFYGGFTLYDYRSPRDNPNIDREIMREFKNLAEAQEDIISQIIQRHIPETKFTLMLYYLPEQGEDIYSVLIDDQRVAILEVPRRRNADSDAIDLSEVQVDVVSIGSYRIRSKKLEEKVAVAIRLMRDLIQKASESATENGVDLEEISNMSDAEIDYQIDSLESERDVINANPVPMENPSADTYKRIEEQYWRLEDIGNYLHALRSEQNQRQRLNAQQLPPKKKKRPGRKAQSLPLTH